MRTIISTLARKVIKALVNGARKYRKVRWAYLAAIPFVVALLVIAFDWDFVKHVFLAMGVEAVIHFLGGSAVASVDAAESVA